jgi:hypothetical protein
VVVWPSSKALSPGGRGHRPATSRIPTWHLLFQSPIMWHQHQLDWSSLRSQQGRLFCRQIGYSLAPASSPRGCRRPGTSLITKTSAGFPTCLFQGPYTQKRFLQDQQVFSLFNTGTVPPQKRCRQSESGGLHSSPVTAWCSINYTSRLFTVSTKTVPSQKGAVSQRAVGCI